MGILSRAKKRVREWVATNHPRYPKGYKGPPGRGGQFMPKDKKTLTQVAKSLRAKKGKGAAEDKALQLAENKLKSLGVSLPSSKTPAPAPGKQPAKPASQKTAAASNPAPAKPETPGSELASKKLAKNHVVSPEKRYSADALDKAFGSIKTRGAAERAGALKVFMKNQGIQVVFATDNHKKTLIAANSALDAGPSVKNLDVKGKAAALTMHGKAQANGFTSAGSRHVVVRGSGQSGEFRVSEKIGDLTAVVASLAGKEPKPWSMSDVIRKASGAGDSDNRAFITYIHEVGHQVHYAGGTKSPPKGVKFLTKYSATNPKEYFAEHFAAYMLDADAFKRFDPIGAKFIEEQFKNALQAKRRVP